MNKSEEGAMPTYEFKCEKCDNEFSKIMSVQELEQGRDRMRCPKCKSKKVKQVMSPFIAKTSHKG